MDKRRLNSRSSDRQNADDSGFDNPMMERLDVDKRSKWYFRIFEPKENNMENMNRQILQMAVLVAVCFLGLIVYLVHFQVVESGDIITNSYNKRTATYGENLIKGTIYSSNGKELAVTEVDEDGEESRVYPYDRMFAHVIGYDSNGRSGLEGKCIYQLLTTNANPLALLLNSIKGEQSQGDNVVTTLDTRIQKAAYDALGDRRGAVVVMEPDTGRILAMVSKPDFNPNKIEYNWEDFVEDTTTARLLNRATQGLYPPGSTFKVLTALSYMEQNKNSYQEYCYECEGSILEHGVDIGCYSGKVHGEIDLQTSLAKSCNTSFVNLGVSLDQDKLKSLCETFLFNTSISFKLDTKKSSYVLSSETDEGMIPQTVIGQGDTLLTPLHNAMIISAIANDGVMMEPILIDSITDFTGRTVKSYKSDAVDTVIPKKTARIMQNYLSAVVEDGTATGLQSDLYDAAGKTGTAENSSGADHSWFIGYASTDEVADVAISVIVENGGAGSTSAVPIAKKVFNSFYNNDLNKE